MYFRYAKSYTLIGLPVTLACWYIVYGNGPGTIGMLLFLKLATMAVGAVALRKRHRQDVFFYRNLGYSEERLLGAAGVADFLLWVLGLAIIVNTRY